MLLGKYMHHYNGFRSKCKQKSHTYQQFCDKNHVIDVANRGLFAIGRSVWHSCDTTPNSANSVAYKVTKTALAEQQKINKERTTMKKSLPILLLAIVMVLAVCFAACTPKQDDTTKTLTDIEIVSKPTKLQYKEGETFDKTGLKVNAVYSDGSKADVTDKCTFSPDGALKASTTKVFVVYSEDVNGKPLRKSKAIDVTVTGDPANKVDFLVDLTPTPADLPHNAITTSTADMLFYGFYDSTSMKCESMLELTSTADNSGTFVFVEMVGHSGTNYRLGRIEGTYAIDGDNITLTATKVHNVAKSATDSAEIGRAHV